MAEEICAGAGKYPRQIFLLYKVPGASVLNPPDGRAGGCPDCGRKDIPLAADDRLATHPAPTPVGGQPEGGPR